MNIKYEYYVINDTPFYFDYLVAYNEHVVLGKDYKDWYSYDLEGNLLGRYTDNDIQQVLVADDGYYVIKSKTPYAGIYITVYKYNFNFELQQVFSQELEYTDVIGVIEGQLYVYQTNDDRLTTTYYRFDGAEASLFKSTDYLVMLYDENVPAVVLYFVILFPFARRKDKWF